MLADEAAHASTDEDDNADDVYPQLESPLMKIWSTTPHKDAAYREMTTMPTDIVAQHGSLKAPIAFMMNHPKIRCLVTAFATCRTRPCSSYTPS